MAPVTLITGGTGLIGSWVERWWDPDRDGTLISVRRADLDLLESGAPARMIEAHQPDRVVHLAWCSSGSPGYRDSADNARWVRASLELATVCRETGVRLWLTGSIAEGIPSGHDDYTNAKEALRRAVDPELRSGRVGWLRPAYVFDEKAGRPAVVNAALRTSASGSVTLNSPAAAHDFVHASDVGHAIVVILRHGLFGVLPIGSGSLRLVADLVDALGVPWVPAGPGAKDRLGHSGHVADTRYLRDHHWSPTRTERFFAN